MLEGIKCTQTFIYALPVKCGHHYTKFHPSGLNGESMGRNLSLLISKYDGHWAKFRDNPISHLVGDTGLWMDGWMGGWVEMNCVIFQGLMLY